MSTYETLAVIASLGNLSITVFLLLANRSKAAAARVDEIERSFTTRSNAHAVAIERISATLEGIPSHEDLGNLYEVVRANSEQLHQLVGQVQQMNANLAMVLSRSMARGD